VLRAVGENPLGSPEVQFLDKLIPHLARAVGMQLQNYTFSTKALVGHALVNKLRQPAVLLTTSGGVVLANEAAKNLLSSTSLVNVTDGELRLPVRYQTQFREECARLEGLARGVNEDPDAISTYRSMVVTALGGAGHADETLYTFFTLLVPPKVSGAFGLRPLVLLFFYHPESVPPVDADLLGVVFNLTPAEGRVSRLLADGLSPKEVSSQLGVQYETVRKQIKSIFRKTTTNRQSDLMRLMLHLPLSVFN
jgi:DNA-binding CsgD family transcriptional regulator